MPPGEDCADGAACTGGVVCVGGAVADRVLRLIEPAVPGTSNPARVVTGSGGVARNVAANLARLGVPVGLVSRVGEDEAGRQLLAELGAADRCEIGVDCSEVEVVAGVPTAQYVAILGPGGELVIAAAAMEIFDGFDPGRTADAVVPGRWVFADTNLPAPVLARVIKRARGSGVPLFVDAVSTAKVTRLPPADPPGPGGSTAGPLTGIHILFCNVDEARAYCRADPSVGEPELAGSLLAAGARAVVLTLGARGALVADGRGLSRVDAVPATVADVTGAGDALVAGTIAALTEGRALVDAVGAGTRLAAGVVATHGTAIQPRAALRPRAAIQPAADQLARPEDS